MRIYRTTYDYTLLYVHAICMVPINELVSADIVLALTLVSKLGLKLEASLIPITKLTEPFNLKTHRKNCKR